MISEPRSREEALAILSKEFSLEDIELDDLSRAFLGLPKPYILPEARDREDKKGGRELPESFPRVLGMVGYMRSGKDVVASFLDEEYKGVKRLAFSDPIIGECNQFLSPLGHRITEENKDDYRLFLQSWSMARRSEEEDYWSVSLRKEIDKYLSVKRLVILTGARLPADVRLIDEYQGELWRVVRPGGKKSLHPNEAWIEEIVCQHTIYNDVEGNTEPLLEQVEDRVSSFK